ncbi:hypothetical protein OPW33_09615 [Vibrio europaeus]|uniref:hypothetical protein n=1 Tax=Vibrio europaeus TaxID=300876 RepID=UPI002340E30F|nr:hypothetical protein [Vibrio europaeus]MDC5839592.1 hypothetical protein [Vibrio europaeus]
MELPAILSSTGLTLDIIAAMLIWFFGIPKILNRGGGVNLKARSDNPAQEKRELRREMVFDVLANLGAFLLIVGFGFQLSANFV